MFEIPKLNNQENLDDFIITDIYDPTLHCIVFHVGDKVCLIDDAKTYTIEKIERKAKSRKIYHLVDKSSGLIKHVTAEQITKIESSDD